MTAPRADGRCGSTRADAALRIVAVLLGLVVATVGGVPLLALWWLSSPQPAPSAEESGTMDRLRDVAYGLHRQDVRSAVDHGADLPSIARSIGATTMTAGRLRSATAPGAEQFVLVGARATGATGVSVDLVESRVPTGSSSTLFAREGRAWVGCYRVELPETAIAATTWSARDATCPTFSTALQHADRVHVDGVVARPLLRPPCFGTTGYCPGG